MRVLICGIDGYIGWPLALHLLNKDHEVCGLDNLIRRDRVRNLGSGSLTPIPSSTRRATLLKRFPNFIDYPAKVDMVDCLMLGRVLKEYAPDAIVHLAEQPSAPWSMKSGHFAGETQYDNVLGTLNLLWTMKEHCPKAHLVKLGTMGEYGTPDCDIPEGEIPEECMHRHSTFNQYTRCPMQGLSFPRSANSFYHLSKVHDTHNIIFACKNWGLHSTDIMQGIVFGLNYGEEELLTRFDYDEYFGTVLNRFCTQAIIGHPLTVYGSGEQKRGFLTLSDSIQCITLALENPLLPGEYRTFNQFESIYSIGQLAEMVVEAMYFYSEEKLADAEVTHIKNPRKEVEVHYYNPTHQKLLDLGYKPNKDIQAEISELIETILPYKDRVIKEVIMPKTRWTDD